ncbi:MAG: hypothetical protein ACREOS_12235, partial [Candidatus Dormibacteraceae bacterium]
AEARRNPTNLASSVEPARIEPDSGPEGGPPRPRNQGANLADGGIGVPTAAPPTTAERANRSDAALDDAPGDLGESSRIPSLDGAVTTRIGGVLYLINLMTHLNLPSCFEEDWGLESRVGSWGVLELLGRALIKRDAAALRDDPLWTALAALDRRPEGALPGALLRPVGRFSLPGGWPGQVERTGRSVIYWSTWHGRLRLWSAEGYVLADLPRGDRPARAEALALSRAEGLDGATLRRRSRPPEAGRGVLGSSTLIMPISDAVREWLSMVAPYLRVRLRRSLAVNPRKPLDLDTTLLRRAGRLYLSATHVDLVLPLDDVSIAVRLAGLDRDPGWLPGFGRVVKFHYE